MNYNIDNDSDDNDSDDNDSDNNDSDNNNIIINFNINKYFLYYLMNFSRNNRHICG
jgi:hypothetical protein